jgi:hypothetical protein
MNAMGVEVEFNGIEDKIEIMNNNRKLEILYFFHSNCTKLNLFTELFFSLMFLFIITLILIQVASVWNKHDQRFKVLKTL